MGNLPGAEVVTILLIVLAKLVAVGVVVGVVASLVLRGLRRTRGGQSLSHN